MTTYRSTSPYYKTLQSSWYLDLYKHTSIPIDYTDTIYTIPAKYNFRPDRAAKELYESEKLWRIFAIHNINIIKDPIFDFIENKQIYILNKERLKLFK